MDNFKTLIQMHYNNMSKFGHDKAVSMDVAGLLCAIHVHKSMVDYEIRLDKLVDQWSKVSNPRHKQLIESWIDQVQAEFVTKFYQGYV